MQNDLSSQLSSAARIFLDRFQDLLVISILGSALMTGLGVLAFDLVLGEGAGVVQMIPGDGETPPVVDIDGAALVTMLIVLVVAMAAWVIPVTLIADGEIAGRRVDLIRALWAIPRHFPRVFLVQMAWMLIVFLGWMLFFLPGIYLMVRYWVVAVASVLEGVGDFRAFSRAAALTHGFRWTYAAILVPGGAAMLLTNLIASALLGGLGFSLGFTAFVASLVTQFVFTSGLFVLQTVSYHAGRARAGTNAGLADEEDD